MSYGMNGWNKPGGDLISRAAAIDAFLTELTKREWKNFLHTWSTVEVKYFVADMLEKLPSAQPEPRRGKWYDWKGNIVTSGYCGICSACGEDSEYLTDYCPNCGADMKGTWEVEHD